MSKTQRSQHHLAFRKLLYLSSGHEVGVHNLFVSAARYGAETIQLGPLVQEWLLKLPGGSASQALKTRPCNEKFSRGRGLEAWSRNVGEIESSTKLHYIFVSAAAGSSCKALQSCEVWRLLEKLRLGSRGGMDGA